ncbi:MAG: hypothetical protein GY768_02130 [Planctomycetaceae bacterium]|nr:hypothetical protein [Planctomycetaceae bacterium]
MRELVICEQNGEWAAIFRRYFQKVAETRLLADCAQFVEAHPRAVVVIETCGWQPAEVADWVTRVRAGCPDLLILAIVSRENPRGWSNWLREMGVVDLLTSFQDLPRVKRIVQRHFARFSCGPLSLEQRIWNNLPWS